MHILLNVFKIAGISVGVLLLFLIFLLILLLFIPFQYQIYGKVPKAISNEGHIEWKHLELEFKISFLCVLFQAVWEYKKNKRKGVIRILGIKIACMGEKEEKEPRKVAKEEEKTAKNRGKIKELENDTEKENQEDRKKAKEKEPNIEKQQDRDKRNITYIESETIDREEPPIKNKKKRNIFKTIINFPIWLINTAKAVWNRFRGFQQLGNTIIEKGKKIADIWNNEHVRNGVSILWEKGKVIGAKLRPRSMEGYLHFGLCDPADTGRMLGIFSIAYAFIGDTIKIEPDFEKPVFDGELKIQGRIPVFSLIRIIWKIYRDKEVRYALERIRKIKDL